MAAPRHQIAIINEVKAKYPAEWRNAHRDYPQRTADAKERATRFMRLLVATLNKTDSNYGLNGKRGNGTDLSQDAISYKSQDAIARKAGGVYIIDVINGAGGTNPQPAWTDVTQATVDAGTIGKWVFQDSSVLADDPEPDPEPDPSDLEARVAALEDRLNRWIASY
jgi:hypothetical protein